MKEQITIDADLADLEQIGNRIASILENAPDLSEESYGIQLAVHECLTNIVVHAYGDTKGDINITLSLDNKQFCVNLHDHGRQFSIDDIKHPDLENGQIHGYGIFLMHELMDEVWGDRFVSDSALSSRIKSVRAATGDDGKAQRVIRTVHGKGFTFVAEVD